MSKYEKYSIEDFLSDGLFQDWVVSPTAEKDLYWHNISVKFPELSETINEAKNIAEALHNQPQNHPTEPQIKRIWQQIKVKTHITSPFTQFFNYQWFSAASVIMLLTLSAVWWFINKGSDSSLYSQLVITSKERLVEVKNNDTKPFLVLLSDGSSVMLQKNSRLSYPQKFEGDTREVYLEGEALFEVAKNAEQPFFVYANELVTKVLGTSFVVKAYAEQKNVEVLVKTGKVSVYRLVMAQAKKITESKELDGVVITPNQQIVYGRATTEFKKSIIEQPIEVKTQTFEFKNESVSNILKNIQQAYGITIIYDENILSTCPLTASLSDEPLYGKLDLICRAIGADYQVIDGQIVVNSKGCQ
jgi:transmembrane sensor